MGEKKKRVKYRLNYDLIFGEKPILKKCPFCGGKAKVEEYDVPLWNNTWKKGYYIKCFECECQTKYVKEDRDEVVKLWNMRF